MARFQILDWDSEFFGISVAKILPDKLSEEELDQVISSLEEKGVELAYWASSPNDEGSQRAAQRFRGFLADKKVTFSLDVRRIPGLSENFDWVIEEYPDRFACADLERLAVQAGFFSRFRRDSRIPEEKFVDLYLQWMRKSVSGQMADAVLVARRSGSIVGVVTLMEKNGSGHIGLLAVDESVRGKALGMSLVRAAQAWTLRRGLPSSEVVTQGDNIASCNLYEKCGYRTKKTEYLYHFWI